MRKLLIVHFCVFQIYCVVAQQYNNLVETGKEFLIQQTFYTFLPLIVSEVDRKKGIKPKNTTISWYKIIVLNDTFINNTKYNKVIEVAENIKDYYYINEDNKKIVRLQRGEITKLYNFNIKAYDTVGVLICYNTDTAIYEGIKRRRYFFRQACRGCDNAVWVEGLGNMKQIFNHRYKLFGNNVKIVSSVGSGEVKTKLIRVLQNNKTLYLDDSFKNYDFSKIDSVKY